MLVVLSAILIILLFHLRSNPKILLVMFLCIILLINFILNIPRELKEGWMYDFVALLSILFVYIFLLIGVNLTMKVLTKFNPNGLRYKNMIRQVYFSFCVFVAFFAVYMFFIKGVIYD
ncbi:hypothetical protein [Pasteurella sp. PK-2025]|uniref:hypothetical protein n=1 Tax=unclassified Pasteurella TaxID=2621516 RepID=UPI003C7638BF